MSGSDIALQNMESQQPEMIAFFTTMLAKMDDLKNAVDPDQPDDISYLSSESKASTSTSGRTRRSRWGHTRHRGWTTHKPKLKNLPFTHP